MMIHTQAYLHAQAQKGKIETTTYFHTDQAPVLIFKTFIILTLFIE